jgi:hypothetical protein
VGVGCATEGPWQSPHNRNQDLVEGRVPGQGPLSTPMDQASLTVQCSHRQCILSLWSPSGFPLPTQALAQKGCARVIAE